MFFCDKIIEALLIQSRFASLPKPKETEWELELPEDQQEYIDNTRPFEEDAAERDRRTAILREAAELADFKRRTQVMQRALPRPVAINIDTLMKAASAVAEPSQKAVAMEMVMLIADDSKKYPMSGSEVRGVSTPLEKFGDDELENAKQAIALEAAHAKVNPLSFNQAWEDVHSQRGLLGLSVYALDQTDEEALVEAFQQIQNTNLEKAKKGIDIEKKLALHLGGYQRRAKTLRQKIFEAGEALEKARIGLDTFRTLQISEDAAIPRRLEALREEVTLVSKRGREAQETYKARREELERLNGLQT
jgi:pre-mRNA-splicing factor CDC5/CEF1